MISLHHTLTSLSERDFLRLWLSLITMHLGTQMQMISRTFLVYQLTGSATILGLVGGSISVPMLGLGLFGGALADRLDRKLIVQGGQIGITTVALLVAVSISTDTVTWVHLLVASLLQGSMWSVLAPARQAIIPDLVSRPNLTNAMALTAGGRSLTTLIAPAIGGILYAIIGPAGVYYIVGGMGFLSVALTSSINKKKSKPPRSDANIFTDVRSGLEYLRTQRLVMVVLFVGLITSLLANPIVYVLPTFVVDIYHLESGAFGLLISALGLGALLGSLTIAAFGPKRRGLLLVAGGLVSALGLTLIALVPRYYPSVVFMLLLGIGNTSHLTLSHTLAMELVTDEFRGRIASVFTIGTGLLPLGLLPLGFAMDLWGGRVAIGALAVILFVASATIMLTQQQLRRLN